MKSQYRCKCGRFARPSLRWVGFREPIRVTLCPQCLKVQQTTTKLIEEIRRHAKGR